MEKLTVVEAAKRLGISEAAVRKRIQRGQLESLKDGFSVYALLDSDLHNQDYLSRQDDLSSILDLKDQIIELQQKRIEDLKERVLSLEKTVAQLWKTNSEAQDLIRAHIVTEQRLLGHIEEARQLKLPKAGSYRIRSIYEAGAR